MLPESLPEVRDRDGGDTYSKSESPSAIYTAS